MLVKNQRKMLRKHGFLLSFCLLSAAMVLICANSSYAQSADELNESLKNAIEQNQELIVEKNDLKKEIKRLNNLNLQEKNRYLDMEKDKESLSESMREAKSENRRYQSSISDLEKQIDELKEAKNEYDSKIKRLEQELLIQQRWNRGETLLSSPSKPSEEVVKTEANTLDLLSKIDAFTEEDQKLREDSARAHYNMGNIYFQKGDYEIAFREYYQAVTLMPNDPDAHYNLAYISGEYLNDQKTALKHYQMYLYLKPDAEDAPIVKEKIIDARLRLRTTVDSPLNK